MTEPCSLVIFGPTGNLARNKLLPALYQLETAEKLSPATHILGFGRREWSDSDWRDELAGILENRVRGAVDDTVFQRLAARLHFVPGDLTDAEAYGRLRERLRDDPAMPANLVFYLSIAPRHYGEVADQLSAQELHEQDAGWVRLVVEKPFGFDLESASILEEQGVGHNSTTETYAALKLYIDNWRWRNVPFYLRTGKRMAETNSMIGIRFKHPPQQLFRHAAIEQLKPNWILLSIQPSECVRVERQVKQEGLEMRTQTERLDASSCAIGSSQIDAYEGLILDIIAGDHSLFLRSDEVSWAWQVVDPVLKLWATERDYIQTYPAGSWGPREATRLFDRDDQDWRNDLEG
jgi:glucose-6-phosphate 1-dehydrogenase